MNTENYLYDIHYHAYDLSHAHLSAFVSRALANLPVRKCFIKLLGPYLINKLDKLLPRIQNTLAVLEYPIEDHFLIIEYYLKHKAPELITSDNKIKIPDSEYTFDKLVICPLMMDFGQKGVLDHKGFYKEMPGKPIVNQTVDLFNAIKNYYQYELIKKDGKLKKVEINNPESKPFVILPFLGINPVHYTSGKTTLNTLFDQYFKGYEKDDKQARMDRAFNQSIDAFLKFNGKLKGADDKDVKLPNMFFGVKVYPPLGFNPHHDESYTLYDLCLEKKLPVTTHCSDGGFVTENKNNQINFTSPLKNWDKVLSNEEYKNLKLDYAHFGVQSKDKKNKKEWRKKIIDQMNSCDRVYADISSLAHEENFYDELFDWLAENDTKKVSIDRLMFGTDFIINLLEMDSYNHYLKNLRKCNSNVIKTICNINPERFLFETD